jgi:ubiquitin carboxyl-terminal hydrolase 7
MPLPELERLKSFRVGFHSGDTKRVVVVEVRVPIDANTRDVLRVLRVKLGAKVGAGKKLRFFETFQSKIYKVFPWDKTLDDVNDQYWVYRAEEVPLDELRFGDSEGVLNADGEAKDESDENGNQNQNQTQTQTQTQAADGDLLIRAYHFYRDEASCETPASAETAHCSHFGDPFFFKIGATETVFEVKKRVRAKLSVPDAEFRKWAFHFHALGKTTPLVDDEVLAPYFASRKDAFGQNESYLGEYFPITEFRRLIAHTRLTLFFLQSGLEHPDLNPRKTAVAMRAAAGGGYDQRAVKIYG